MARFTVADCMDNIDNRFNMTLIAALRARQIENGNPTLLGDTEGDKPTVLALREIAASLVDSQILQTIE